MSGYIGSKTSVTQVDGYNRTEADAEFVQDPNGAITVSGSNVGIGTSSPSFPLSVQSNSSAEGLLILGRSSDDIGEIEFRENDNSTVLGELQYRQDHAILRHRVGDLRFATGGTSERMRIDSSGNLLVNKTSSSVASTGTELRAGGNGIVSLIATSSGTNPAYFNRLSSDGTIVNFAKDGSTVGSIGSAPNAFFLSSSLNELNLGSRGSTQAYMDVVGGVALSTSTSYDGSSDLGRSNARFDDIYATNGTIQTSDRNEKQDIASLTATEMLVAARISGLFKTFRWIDSVADKGDNARTHTGVIAQDVQAAFIAEGLDAGDYALFTSATWWEAQTDVAAVDAVAEVTDEDGNVTTEAVEAADAYTRTDTFDTLDEAPDGATERTRMGIRYPELLSFLAAYNEQRFAAIETRLTALEG